MLPRKSKHMYNIAASDKVVEVRTALKDASMKNIAHSTRASQKHLESAKEALDQAYTEALESCIQTKIEELDSLHHEYKNAASWELLQETTNTKAAPVVRVKGNTSDERRDNMFHHFSNLLGRPVQDISLEDSFFCNSHTYWPIHYGGAPERSEQA